MKRRANWLLMGLFMILPVISQAEEKGEAAIYATEIIDVNVYDSKGQEIAEIDDLVIRRNGKIKKVTMEVNGFLDIGDKLIAYPFDKLVIKKEKISMNATQAELEKKEEFDYYAHALSRGYYYGPYPPYGVPAYGPYYGRYRGRYDGPAWWANVPHEGMGMQSFESEIWSHSKGRFLASVVLDRYMIDPVGRRLGRVRDFVINRKGEVKKIVIEAEVLNDDIHVALPYEGLGFTYYGVVYDITRDELEKLPKLDYKE